MYISKITPNPELNATSLAPVIAAHAYSVHKLLWDLFPDQEKRDFLYREERADEQLDQKHLFKGLPVYYLVSRQEPVSNLLFQAQTKPYEPKLSAGDELSFRLRANPTVTRDGRRHDLVMDSQYRFLRAMSTGLNLGHAGADSGRLKLKQVVLSADRQQVADYLRSQADAYHLPNDIGSQNPEILDALLAANVERTVNEWLARVGKRTGFDIIDSEDHFSVTRYERHVLPEKGPSAEFRSVDIAGRLRVTDPATLVNCLYTGVGRAKAFGCGLMLIKR